MTGLPAEITFGKVAGRWILAVADTAADPDRLPEAKAPSGDVKFTRLDVNTSLLDTTQNDGTYVGVARQHVATILDDTGELRLPHDTDLPDSSPPDSSPPDSSPPASSPPGVWLITGWYRVEAKIANVSWPTFNIEVTTEHTDQKPLDLIAWTPVAPPIGGSLTVVQIPAGVPNGYLLAKNGASFTGIDPATLAAPDASETAKGLVELATSVETVTGDDATRATTPAGVKAALDAKSVSDMSTYAARAHKTRHATGGADALTPTDIGAQPAGSYEAAGAAAAAVSAHAGAADPHPGYALETALGNAATKNVGTAAGTVAAGDDGRFHAHPAVIAQGATQAAARAAIGAASAAHTHAPEDVTGTAVITTDARLADARTPLAHSHTLADVTDAGDAAGLDVGTTAGTVMAGDDSRVTSLSSTYVAQPAAGDPAGMTPLSDGAGGYSWQPGGGGTPGTPQTINAQTGTTYELVASDASKLVTCTNSGAITVTVPASTFTAGQRVDMAVLGEGMVTLVGSGITLNPEAGLSLVSRAQYSAFTIYFLTATTAFVTGSMAAA